MLLVKAVKCMQMDLDRQLWTMIDLMPVLHAYKTHILTFTLFITSFSECLAWIVLCSERFVDAGSEHGDP